jgi:transposase-like protein
MRESAAVERAVARYQAGGHTVAAAAEAEDVSRSALIRALRRRGVEPAAPGRPAVVKPMPEPYRFHDGTLLTPRPARKRKP